MTRSPVEKLMLLIKTGKVMTLILAELSGSMLVFSLPLLPPDKRKKEARGEVEEGRTDTITSAVVV